MEKKNALKNIELNLISTERLITESLKYISIETWDIIIFQILLLTLPRFTHTNTHTGTLHYYN